MSRALGAGLAAVMGLSLVTAASAQEVTAGWQDTASVGTSLQTVDVDTVSYRESRDIELKRIMIGIGDQLDSVPDGDSYPRARSGRISIDPLAFDRTRPNLSYCHYRDGSWSVAATSAYSARAYQHGIEAIPLTEQWIYSSRDGFFNPTQTLENGWGQRCDSDRIRVAGLDRPDSSSGQDSAGWIWGQTLGVIKNPGYESQFVFAANDLMRQREQPWVGDDLQVKAWSDVRSSELQAMMRSTGNALARVPDGQSVSTPNLVADTIRTLDPRSLDRSRLNLSFCLYRTGDWSVTATSAYSAIYSANGSATVPLDEQWIHSSRHGTFNPSAPLPPSAGPRCDLDRIPASADRLNAGWLWHTTNGASQANTWDSDSTWVLASQDHRRYGETPWAFDIAP